MDLRTLGRSISNLCRCTDCKIKMEEKENKKGGRKGPTLNDVTVSGLPKDCFVCKLDKINVKGLFHKEGEWHFNKHGDYMIVSDSDVVVVELKSDPDYATSKKNEITMKFRSDAAILDYCDGVFRHVLDKKAFFQGKKMWYVLLYLSTPLSMESTSIKSAASADPSHNTPETFASIGVRNNDEISYKRLLVGF